VVLGVLEGRAPFEEHRTQLSRGARLLLYTDGVTEAANPADEESGEKRLEELIRGEGA
jgi:sigma-B regulation protein RsbU (phosphoserine phosphatase)